MSSGPPLRDIYQSNSPSEPTEWRSPATTPLKIAKRDSPQRGAQLTRRQSSSYNHLKKNHLVSKSPFKSQIPTPHRPSNVSPSPRRVSGEKRTRPPSMHEQAENEHPLGFKRRQSRAFQGLLEKEPVTKSPFKAAPTAEDIERSPPQAVPPKRIRRKIPDYGDGSVLAPPVPPKHVLSPRSSPRPHASPARPSLVSKRLHGPRESGNYGRKTRRKTVTFDERCDVMEFSADEEDSNAFDWVTDEDEESLAAYSRPQPPPVNDPNESYDSSQGGDDSLTGLMDSMLQDSEPRTPTHHKRTFPDDLDHEGGVPYGRTHHADRAAVVHNLARHERGDSLGQSLVLVTHHNLSTPPRSREVTPVGTVPPGNQAPLGRSTHSERQKAFKEEDAGVDEDVQMLPPSPSPAKRTGILPVVHHNTESLIPRLNLGLHKEDSSAVPNTKGDPFEANTLEDESQLGDSSFMSAQLMDRSQDGNLNAPNLSVGQSEVSLSGIEIDVESITRTGSRGSTADLQLPLTSTPPTSPPTHSALSYPHKTGSIQSLDKLIDLDSPPPSGPYGSLRSNSPRVGSPAGSRSGSPLLSRNASPFHPGLTKSTSESSLHSPCGSLSGRNPRINREDVHRRLLNQRSVESPLRGVIDIFGGGVDGHTAGEQPEKRRASGSRSLPTPPTTGSVAPSTSPLPHLVNSSRPSPPSRTQSEDNLLPRIQKDELPKISLDFSAGSDLGSAGTDVGNGLGMGLGETPLGDMRSALDRLMDDVAGEVSIGPTEPGTGIKVEAITAGVPTTQFRLPSERMGSEAPEEHSREVSVHDDAEMTDATIYIPPRPAFDPPRPPVISSSLPKAEPPHPPPKDAIRTREELIKRKKREARQREEEEEMGLRTPPRNLGLGRPSRRRSQSTGDVENFGRKGKGRPSTANDGGLLADVPVEEDLLADSIDRELRKLQPADQRTKYHVREHSETIYASSDADRVVHSETAGDVDGGKAWRAVRRPSDMNEYSKQIKALRAQGGKAYGKVFLKVLGVKNLIVPIPEQPTAVSCTLNNGIHFVTTPECPLVPDSLIEQEFELIETSKLEITLSLKVRRDPHIVAQFKANAPPMAPPPVVAPLPTSKGGGMRSFFLGSPKKPKAPPQRAAPPTPIHRLQENLARYLTSDGTLARAFIQFKDIARHCDTRLFETAFPLIGQKLEVGGSTKSMQVGELVLQVFRLPPLPGIPSDQLPQSLEECHRGLRHINWHKLTYFEGTLTQSGGDCVSWRRRHLRIIGSNLVAFNDVTKKATATIDLRKAIGIEDDEVSRNTLLSPASGAASRYSDEYECPYGAERSFRLIFTNNEEIMFFADSDEEKARWLDVLHALVGHIPPRPLWAELVWLRQEELSRQAGSAPNHEIGS